MCTTCGCSDEARPEVTGFGDDATGRAEAVRSTEGHGHGHARDHAHPHGHDHAHDHGHGHGRTETPSGRRVRLEQDILARNDLFAARNRGWLEGRGIVAWNLMSSPGAGKTTLLERTIRDLGGELEISVIEGDQATLRDAERIRAVGGRVVQINTGSGCHLDADMLGTGLRRLDPPARSLVLIENVGNLVCPALFDLGEHEKVVIVSVTEGEDKPLKYPHMFRAARWMILNKIDLLPHLRFDVGECLAHARRVNPDLEILEVSATLGDGLERWYDLLRSTRPREAAV